MTPATIPAQPSGALFRRLDFAALVSLFVAQLLLIAWLLPTFFTDTAEAIIWGRMQPMASSHKHPPLMGMVAALLTLFGEDQAWKAYLLQLLLNGLALFYTNRIAAFIMPDARRMAVMFGLSLTLVMSFWSAAGYSLNADMVGMPFWAGALYHAMAAKRNPQAPWHWLALGLCLGLAFLAKYFALLLWAALFAASLIVPSYRSLWRRPQLLLTVGVSLLVVAPHVFAVLQSPETLHYAGRQFGSPELPYWLRSLRSVLRLVLSLIVMGLPALGLYSLAVWVGHRRLSLDVRALYADGDRAFVSTVFAAIMLLALGAIIAGVDYRGRFNAPVYPLFALIWFSMMPIESLLGRRWIRRMMRLSMAIWALGIAVTCVLYSFFATHFLMQEPLPQLASHLRKEWNSRFSCGPAYIAGDWRTAPTTAAYYSRHMIGVTEVDLDFTPWFSWQKARERGMIYLAMAEPSLEWNKAFSLDAPVEKITLTTVRSKAAQPLTYYYQFQPPKGCS